MNQALKTMSSQRKFSSVPQEYWTGLASRKRKGHEGEAYELRVPKTRPENLDRRLSLMLAEEPIQIKQMNAEPRFCNA